MPCGRGSRPPRRRRTRRRRPPHRPRRASARSRGGCRPSADHDGRRCRRRRPAKSAAPPPRLTAAPRNTARPTTPSASTATRIGPPPEPPSATAATARSRRRRAPCRGRAGSCVVLSGADGGGARCDDRAGGEPVARSVSSACCTMMTAAAWSTTCRAAARVATGRLQAPGGLRGGQPLVDQAHGHVDPAAAEQRRRSATYAPDRRRPPAPRCRRGRAGGPPRPRAARTPRRGRRARSGRCGARRRPWGAPGSPRVRRGRRPGRSVATPTRTEPTSTPIRIPRRNAPDVGELTRPTVARTAACAAARAASTPATSVPPPWAMSSLPPPRPPTARRAPPGARALADCPASRPASLVAATSDTLPSATAAPTTTDGISRRALSRPLVTSSRSPAASVPSGAVKVQTRTSPYSSPRPIRPSMLATSGGRAHLRDLALGVLEPGQRGVDPLGQLLGPRLDAGRRAGRPAGARGRGTGRRRRRRAPRRGARRRRSSPRERNLTTPTWPERCAWVPPHSSRAQSPTDTTRTRSPYFSPNSAMAPAARACSCVMYLACTARSSASTSLTRASTSAMHRGGHGRGRTGSRSGSGRASSPSPSGSRSRRAPRGSALCTRCVAVCAREIARRRARSTRPTTGLPDDRLAAQDPAAVDVEAGHRLLDVVDLEDGAVGEGDHAGVGELPAALGVERGAVEDDLDLLSLPCAAGRRRRRRGARAACPR